jgi:chloramphenicol O-acetyltransferase type A
MITLLKHLYITIDYDITDFHATIKQYGIRFYPTIIQCIMKVVNNGEYYRYGFDEQKNIGIWDTLHPMYTVPRKNNPRLFSMSVTEY